MSIYILHNLLLYICNSKLCKKVNRVSIRLNKKEMEGDKLVKEIWG